ncbi:glycosyltransferase family 92 protein RCOM_0530710 [Rhodamnia argentea]|uniref:Glycosyltransferase family 92 protein n=1 Tax=Rhodamnia argentea TaxID=178133 RepID=A0ABM3HK61_9MYRT|nr:glycosyltransferase family 92 protein RCOM_0530710 [Rhodamnia argentea]XP_048136980.1 glycosyltransferase family 92 protein RCOM_0530710 [Rhodamnia argentea]
MESEQRRKRKRTSTKPYSASSQLFSIRSLVLCLSFFVFVLFLSSDRSLTVSTASFRPVLSSSTLSLLSSSASRSILDSLHHRRPLSSAPRVEDRVLFPDHVLLLVSGGVGPSEDLECVYYALASDGSDWHAEAAMSADVYNEHRSIVRCPLPPANFSAAEVDLHRCGGTPAHGGKRVRSNGTAAVQAWDKVVYEAELDGETAVVFVKGLNLRPHRRSVPAKFSCHFGWGSWDKDETSVLTTKALSAAQEVIRCSLPRSIRSKPIKAQGVRVTIGLPSNFHTHGRSSVHVPMPSVARIYSSKGISEEVGRKKMMKHELCACTMVWNQAASLREWIMYHAWLGIERWFIYDNNSDDAIKEVIEELDSQNYNVSRQSWPWIKTQEAGFSHCVLRARDECNWVGFFDVDEFFYFPFPSNHRRGLGIPGKDMLRAMVANFSSSSPIIAEIRTACHSFGPSGLTSPPRHGVTVGYTCRLQQPERHKSIVRPDTLDPTLLNEVHHFRLKEGFRYLNAPESIAVINHYKYQVWETFSTKFFRRVATYVVDWQEDQNKGSKDRAPGLGTEAIEPTNWRLQFCEVWDTGLRDFVLANFAHPASSMLPWERSSPTR